jgi:hypothetical protein
MRQPKVEFFGILIRQEELAKFGSIAGNVNHFYRFLWVIGLKLELESCPSFKRRHLQLVYVQPTETFQLPVNNILWWVGFYLRSRVIYIKDVKFRVNPIAFVFNPIDRGLLPLVVLYTPEIYINGTSVRIRHSISPRTLAG